MPARDIPQRISRANRVVHIAVIFFCVCPILLHLSDRNIEGLSGHSHSVRHGRNALNATDDAADQPSLLNRIHITREHERTALHSRIEVKTTEFIVPQERLDDARLRVGVSDVLPQRTGR